MPDSLNERMAEALAPVLGEAAVYNTTFRCSEGHPTSSRYVREGSSCPWILDDERECLLPVTASEKIPVDFADPAVGWGLWEQYTYYNPLAFTVEPGGAGEGFHVRIHPIDPQEYEHGLHGYGRGPRILNGLISAWAQALGVSGDA